MIRVLDDVAALAQAAAETIAAAAVTATAERGVFRVAFSGGTTPRRLFGTLADARNRERVDWSRSEILLADERAVRPDHPDSNYGLLASALLGPAGIPADRVRRMRGEASDLEAEAHACEPWYEIPLDILVLGVGPDGHVASLFPGRPAARERTRRVVAVFDSPKPPSLRLTIAPRVIEEARRILVLATGVEKAAAVAAALEGASDPAQLPARYARAGDWYLDREAASGLTGLDAGE